MLVIESNKNNQLHNVYNVKSKGKIYYAKQTKAYNLKITFQIVICYLRFIIYIFYNSLYNTYYIALGYTVTLYTKINVSILNILKLFF